MYSWSRSPPLVLVSQGLAVGKDLCIVSKDFASISESCYEVKITGSLSWVTSAMQLESSAKANHSSGFASSLSSGLHSTERDVYREPGCLLN